MALRTIAADHIPAAAATLARAMLDEPGGRWLLPDPDEFLEAHERLFVATMTRALDEGRVDAWGDPFVGVAVWLERPAIDDAETRRADDSPALFPEHSLERIAEADRLIQLMRRRARPDRHVYLDSMGVLPEHRRQGIATQLLHAGFAWADERGLPCSLDTLDPANVAFYRRRGFEVVAEEPVRGSTLTVTALRRPASRSR